MAFISTFISMIIKMVIVAVFAFAGIMTGKKLRENKNAKKAAEEK
ncbi:hypothetical protein ABXS75_12580 [Roseburia hominis]